MSRQLWDPRAHQRRTFTAVARFSRVDMGASLAAAPGLPSRAPWCVELMLRHGPALVCAQAE